MKPGDFSKAEAGTEQMWKKIGGMTTDELKLTWAALQSPWESEKTAFPGVTMTDWAETIYSELNARARAKRVHG